MENVNLKILHKLFRNIKKNRVGNHYTRNGQSASRGPNAARQRHLCGQRGFFKKQQKRIIIINYMVGKNLFVSYAS